MRLAKKKAALLALALATIASTASASRTDVDGEPLRAPRVERVQLEAPRFALALERSISIDLDLPELTPESLEPRLELAPWDSKPHVRAFDLPLEKQPQAPQHFELEIASGAWETGFLYARNRFYDPELGRFISADPLEYVDGPNVYAYARNNPLSFTDPMGLAASSNKRGDLIISDEREENGPTYVLPQKEVEANPVGAWVTARQVGGLDAKRVGELFDRAGVTLTDEQRLQLIGMEGKAQIETQLEWAAKTWTVMAATAVTGGAASTLGASGRVAGALAGVGGQGSSDLLEGEFSGLDNYALAAGAGYLLGGATSGARSNSSEVTWNNGWRTPDGKFASPRGDGRSGAAAEQAVWDAVAEKPGWRVIEGRVYVRNASGDLRIYDGAAVSPRGRAIGLEVKSGSATRDASQAAFDSRVNTFNPATGVGRNEGLEVGKSAVIRRP